MVKKRKSHHINVFYSAEDESYIADIPDFEMCSAFGATPQEALEQVLIARDAIIQTMQEKGLPIPRPRYRPAIYKTA
ncbi:MAG: type II toxin-antitoxin system HicB family antitoxin [Anaerolineae bacterium]|nr:type II toxin-antitoxin system HicB family antitoxin [Anaerolineae bacterium]